MTKYLGFVANRLWLIMTIYVVTILAASFLFMVLEKREFHEGLWWAVVTALTIGYGDIAPVTGAGRTMGVLFGHFLGVPDHSDDCCQHHHPGDRRPK